MSARDLPNIAAVLGPLLERVSPEQRPLLMAIAERMAAERYRQWAGAATDPTRQAELLACAEREEQIAGRVESLYPGSAATQADILAKNPDLADVNRSLFAHLPLEDQYTIQAQGERVGAATWRSLAEQAGPEAREAFLQCAGLEEESAGVLESMLSEKVQP